LLAAVGETNNAAGSKSQVTKRKGPIMGDRSPKSVHKQATQKQTKTDTANQKKQQSVADKQGFKAGSRAGMGR
jgi:hypothetical protein